jgi:hypothetical protein
MSEIESVTRRRWITLAEIIALCALIVSALGVWIAWKSSNQDKPTRVVEQKQAIPLSLRGVASSDGSTLTILPADPGHGLESLTVTIKGASPIEIGSDGNLRASDLQGALKERPKEAKGVTYSVPTRIQAHYVEMGTDKSSRGNYVLRYKWEGGGLFGGRSIRLVSLSR